MPYADKSILKVSRIYYDAKRRCYNPNYKQYKNWGGRGIKICKEWLDDKDLFVLWALNNGWRLGLCIDRIDNDGDYESGNIRFIDRKTSALHQRLLIRTNTSGYRGVSWFKRDKKWVSYIKINGKNKNLGYFDSPRIAAIVYDVEAYMLGGGRPTNFF